MTTPTTRMLVKTIKRSIVIGRAMKTAMKTTVTAMAMKISSRGRVMRKSNMNWRRKIDKSQLSTWIPPIQRIL
jgi:hypothetical protein